MAEDSGLETDSHLCEKTSVILNMKTDHWDKDKHEPYISLVNHFKKHWKMYNSQGYELYYLNVVCKLYGIDKHGKSLYQEKMAKEATLAANKAADRV